MVPPSIPQSDSSFVGWRGHGDVGLFSFGFSRKKVFRNSALPFRCTPPVERVWYWVLKNRHNRTGEKRALKTGCGIGQKGDILEVCRVNGGANASRIDPRRRSETDTFQDRFKNCRWAHFREAHFTSPSANLTSCCLLRFMSFSSSGDRRRRGRRASSRMICCFTGINRANATGAILSLASAVLGYF